MLKLVCPFPSARLALVAAVFGLFLAVPPANGLVQDARSDRIAAEAIRDAQQQIARRDFESAKRTLDSGVKAAPKNAALRVLRGQLLLSFKEFKKAAEDADAALASSPGHPDAAALKASVFVRENKHDDALRFIERLTVEHPKQAKLASIHAELLATLILAGEEKARKMTGDAELNLLVVQKRLRVALNHTIAATQGEAFKQQARIFAASTYNKLKEYKLANSAITHAITADKANNPRLRMMRLTVREQWGDTDGQITDLRLLSTNPWLKQKEPKTLARAKQQLQLVEQRRADEQGPVYKAVQVLRLKPSDPAAQQAVIDAFEAIEARGKDHPHYDLLIQPRKTHVVYPEPTLEQIIRHYKNPKDIKAANDADPAGSFGTHTSRAKAQMRINLSPTLKALDEKSYVLNEQLKADERKPVSLDRQIQRQLKVVGVYPRPQAYLQLARLHYLKGEYAPAKRFAALAAAVAAASFYEDPVSISGYSGISITGPRAYYHSASRFIKGMPEPIEAKLAEAYRLADKGEAAKAGEAFEQAHALDKAGRDAKAPPKNDVLRALDYDFRSRHAAAVLDAWVDAALMAKHRKDKAEYGRVIELIQSRYPYDAHANSRVLLSLHFEQLKDDPQAKTRSETYLDSALRTQPLNFWAHKVKADRLKASGDKQLAMMHYNITAGLGAAAKGQKGLMLIAAQHRDRLEKEIDAKHDVNKLYAPTLDKLRQEDSRKHAALIYGGCARMLRDYPQNKNLKKIMHLAAYHLRDTAHTSYTLKQLLNTATAPALEPVETAWAYRLYGYTLVESGDRTAAIAAFTASIKAAPTAPTYSARGLAYFKIGKFEQAIADVDEVIQLKAANWGDYSVQAQSYEARGDLDQAFEAIQAALKLQKQEAGKNNFGLLNVAQRISLKRLKKMGL